MFSVILWSIVVLCLAGLIAYLLLRTTTSTLEPPPSSRELMQLTRKYLKDKEDRPKIYRCCPITKNEDLVPSTEFKKMLHDVEGIYRFRWTELDLKYVVREKTEEVRLKRGNSDDKLVLFYVDGVFSSMSFNHETYAGEQFELRHSGNLANQLRKCLRHHLKMRGGSLETVKYDEPTFTPKLDVNATGEIRLKEVPVSWNPPKTEPENHQ
ncbi:MAG TPA: hypothetical protein PLX97_09535 [Gemmatales bacterium]|nr:hypothetical protein [Gemmatales bacterium]